MTRGGAGVEFQGRAQTGPGLNPQKEGVGNVAQLVGHLQVMYEDLGLTPSTETQKQMFLS